MIALHQTVANCQNTLTVHTQVDDLSSKYMNGSDEYDRCGHDPRQLHPSCTACRKTANLTGPAGQNETPIILPNEKNILVNILF